ncbi:MAG TPA: S1/P1 nuclease, partial [Bryobacteraceae bacterium]|nr:S1/P1 nuclease [Bryobacteraceae bacterium]
SENHDEGGNCTSYRLPFLEKPTTLHGIWDYDLITHELQTRKLTGMELASMLDDEFSGTGKQLMAEKIDVEAWTWEAHKLAISLVYGLLVPPVQVATASAGLADRASCNADRARMAEMNITINQNYMDLALKTIHQQLATAGYRLAAVLNDALQ